jgi:hypothetical protein
MSASASEESVEAKKPNGDYMTQEDDVLAVLDVPRPLSTVHQQLDPGNKCTYATKELLIAMRAAGKVKFDIHSGKWSKASADVA